MNSFKIDEIMTFFKGLFAKNVVKNTINTKKELSLQS